MTRRSVWSKPRIIELLTRFVPVAEEVGRLQRADDAEGVYFRQIAEQGHYAGRTRPTATRQGIYALTPSGRFLASCNTRSARRVERMLRTALERWKALSRVERLGEEAPFDPSRIKRWERMYPADGLVLKVHTRDLPREKAARGWHAWAWNQDFAWFRKEEAQGLVPSKVAVGSRIDVPPGIIHRIARYHLVDNVRGQTSAFSKDSVAHARLTSTVTGVREESISLRFEGAVAIKHGGRWRTGGSHDENPHEQTRGFEAKLLGRATWDERAERFTAFELVAVGKRWGGTRYNGRDQDLEPAPMGVALTLAGDAPKDRVAPSMIWHYRWK